MAHPGGRPLLFKSAEDLQDKIDAYFDHCETNQKPLTICGLAVFLDCDRRTLVNYSERDEFFPTLDKARAKIEAYAAEQLYRKEQVNGIRFDLQNNFGWKNEKTVGIAADREALEEYIKAFRGEDRDSETKTD